MCCQAIHLTERIKIRFNLSFAIAIPVSITQNSNFTVNSLIDTSRQLNATWPFRVTFQRREFDRVADEVSDDLS